MQKYIHEIIKSPLPELLGQFYNKYNHNFAQMYFLIRTSFSCDRSGPWASGFVFYYFFFVVENFIADSLSRAFTVTCIDQTNTSTFNSYSSWF